MGKGNGAGKGMAGAICGIAGIGGRGLGFGGSIGAIVASRSAFLNGGYDSAGFQSAVSLEPTGQTRVSPSKPGSFNSSSIPAGPCVDLPSCAKNRTKRNIIYLCYRVISYYKIDS